MKKLLIGCKVLLVLLISCIILGSPCLAENAMVFIQGPIIYMETLQKLDDQVNALRMNAFFREEEIELLTIVIISSGGSVEEAFAIFDYLQVLKEYGIEVHTIASGWCMSAAMIVLQAGDVRKARESAIMMTHAPYRLFEPMGAFTINSQDAEDLLAGLRRTNQRAIDLFSRRMGISTARLNEYFTNVEVYMEAYPALQLGFIDEVIPDPINWRNRGDKE